MVIGVHGIPVVIGPDPPEVNDAWFHSGSGLSFYWWFNTTNRTWNQHNGSEWVPVEQAGLDLAHDGGKMEITKLTVVGGIITELEYET